MFHDCQVTHQSKLYGLVSNHIKSEAVIVYLMVSQLGVEDDILVITGQVWSVQILLQFNV